jgi:hypothetical protein
MTLPAVRDAAADGFRTGFEVGYVAEDSTQHRLSLADVWAVRFAGCGTGTAVTSRKGNWLCHLGAEPGTTARAGYDPAAGTPVQRAEAKAGGMERQQHGWSLRSAAVWWVWTRDRGVGLGRCGNARR